MKISLRTFVILALMPLFFSTNIVFGREAVNAVEPWTLAFIRWFSCALILMPFAAPSIRQHREVLTEHWKRLMLMGFLGMWICGALVYLALKYTTATNGTLIYTSSPVLIIFLEWAFRGRNVGRREFAGIAVALLGVMIIIFRGDINVLLSLNFNMGDMIFVATAISWSIYSVLLKSPSFDGIPTLVLFTTIALMGAITLAPFTIIEIVYQDAFPSTIASWTNISGIVVFSSLIAFTAFQYGVKTAGASQTGIFMYLLPVYGVGLAVFYLGETFHLYHLAGIFTVSGGVILATIPMRLFRKKTAQPGEKIIP